MTFQKTRAAVFDEQQWLENNRDGLSDCQVDAIKAVLWELSATTTIMRAGQKSLDISSFSTLVAERNLDNFVIDATITKFVDESKSSIYLPTEVFFWLRSNDNSFILSKLAGVVKDDCNMKFILMPVHMNNCHWGLVVVDLSAQRILFDDGLKMNPGKDVLHSVRRILDLLRRLMPHVENLSNSFWSLITSFERFGMPYQGDPDESGQGVASCGVGVILAARDFITLGSLAEGNFRWSYRNTRRLRKQLMVQIISWGESQGLIR